MAKRMKVLIGYDGSTYADAAIDDLRRAGLPREVEALVVSVGDAPVVPPLESDHNVGKASVGDRAISIVNHADTHISQALSEAKDEACAAGRLLEKYFPHWHVHAIAVGGTPATELIQKAREWSANLLVVGSQGRSAVGRLLFGSVSLEVAIDAHCCVRIGRAFKNKTHEARRIVVGLDGSARSERALKQVLKRTWPDGTELRVIAVDDGESPIKIAQLMSARQRSNGTIQLAEAHGLKVFAQIRKGDPANILMTEAGEWKAHCIFIGAGRFGGTIYDSKNSVSTQLATNAGCSVEIVR